MGFLSETVIVAGSSAYNLAGDPSSRGNFMKNTIINAVVSGASANGLGKGIVNSHAAGPATAYRRFGKWAETSGYNAQVGNQEGSVSGGGVLSPAGFDFLVPDRPLYVKRQLSFTVSGANLEKFGQWFVYQYRPERRGQEITVTQEFERISLFKVAPTGRLIIEYPDKTQEIFTPHLPLEAGGTYAYAFYEERWTPPPSVDDTGLVEVSDPSEYPSRAGWTGGTEEENETVPTVVVTKTTVTYSDGTPSEETETTEDGDLIFTKSIGDYDLTQTEDGSLTTPIRLLEYSQKEQNSYELVDEVTTEESSEVVSGVTITTITEKTVPTLQYKFYYRRVLTTTTVYPYEPSNIVIYLKGTDTYGDSVVFGATGTPKKFFPVIPMRRFNVPVDKETFPLQYDWNRKAMHKCFASEKKYTQILDSLNENPDIEQVDHAWVVFAVSLGSMQQDGKSYLFNFFRDLAASIPITEDRIRNATEYEAAWQQFTAAVQAYDANQNWENPVGDRPVPPTPQEYRLAVNSVNGNLDWQYNVIITAKGGHIRNGLGMNPRAFGKKGAYWILDVRGVTITVPTFHAPSSGEAADGNYYTYDPSTTRLITFGHQVTDSFWEEVDFFDLIHTNEVHEGNTVQTLAGKALAAANENTGFLIPLQATIFDNLNLIKRTQLSLECAHLVLNYYDKQKIPFYATGFFKIILVIVVVVISVITTGAGAAAGSGVLGTNAAVGAALGFAGTAAVVAGAVANALAAALVAAVITKASTAIFGDKLGALIGAIVSIVVIGLSAKGGEFSMAESWASMTKADNLLKLTMSGVQTAGDVLAGKAAGIQADTAALLAQTSETLAEIQRMTQELLSGSGISSSMVAEAIRYAQESPEQFLGRTLMTGTDIADATLGLVEDFPQAQLKLPNFIQ